MNKKLIFVATATIFMTLLFTADIALAWFWGYRYRTASDYQRCLGIHCDRTQRVVFRRPQLETTSFTVSYQWTPWRRQPTTCYQFVWE